MPRLNFLDEAELSGEARALLRNAESAGSPDPRVLKILFKSPAGVAWYKYWLELSNNGELPKDLKELCRVKIAFDHECGYCGTVRSSAAKAAGLTEEKIQEVWNFETSPLLSAREKLALRFADHLKHDIGKADDDAFYKELEQHFSDAEIVELGLWCAENVGAGSFVRTLNIISWTEACELNPETARHAAPERASA
jgi:AhpD family alkylhydroperoxidase